MTCALRSALAIAIVCGATSSWAAEAPPPGASSCSGCHGPANPTSVLPAITGRPAGEITAAMSEFREGKRPATVMDRIAKGFTDDETRAIADWLAKNK